MQRPLATASRPAVAGLMACVLLLLGGCGGSSSSSTDTSKLSAQLASARKQLDAAETISIDLSTSHVPTGVTGLLSAQGSGNHSPAFKGTVKVVTGGATLKASIIAVDGKTYAKTGFSPAYLTIDPASLKAPDPASLIATEGGISSILTSTTQLKDAGRSRDGSTVLQAISGSLPGSVVATIIPSARATSAFAVTYRLTDKGALHDVSLKGPFYDKGGSLTYTVGVSTSSKPLTVTAP